MATLTTRLSLSKPSPTDLISDYPAAVGPSFDAVDTSMLVYRGNWNGTTTYAVNDLVTYLGGLYVAIVTSSAQPPTNVSYWAGVSPQVQNVETVTLPAGGIQTISATTSATLHAYTFGAGNATLVFPAAAAGASFELMLVQDGVGSRTITWPIAHVYWPGGTLPTLTTGAGGIDLFSFICLDGVNWLGTTVAQNYQAHVVPLSIDATSGGFAGNGSASVSATHTVAPGASMVVVVLCGSAQGVSSWNNGVTFGGQSMTRVAQSSQVTWSDGVTTLYASTEIWKLANPPSGSQIYKGNNTTNLSGGEMISAVTFFGATTVTSRGVVSGAASTTPSITTNANTTNGNYVVAGLSQGKNSSAPTSDGTTIYNSGNNVGFASEKFSQMSVYKAAANGTTTTVGFTCSDSHEYAGAIVEVGP